MREVPLPALRLSKHVLKLSPRSPLGSESQRAARGELVLALLPPEAESTARWCAVGADGEDWRVYRLQPGNEMLCEGPARGGRRFVFALRRPPWLTDHDASWEAAELPLGTPGWWSHGLRVGDADDRAVGVLVRFVDENIDITRTLVPWHGLPPGMLQRVDKSHRQIDPDIDRTGQIAWCTLTGRALEEIWISARVNA